MSANAKVYTYVLVTLGLVVMAIAFADWHVADPFQFASYFAAAVVASVLKISMPDVAGRRSFNFIFVLIAIANLGLPETLVIGCTAVLIECLWLPRAATTFREILFSMTNMAIAIGCTHATFHWARIAAWPLEARMLAATTSFFGANTFPISSIIALNEHRRVLRVWWEKYVLAYPFYVFGGTVAWIYSVMATSLGWQTAMLILPLAYLLYRLYRMYTARADDERTHTEEMASLHLRTIEALATAIEAKDDTTHEHLKRVQVYALELGRELGLNEIELEALRAAAVLHDIGKLAVPEYIISKPGKLTPEEFEKMKVHPVVGAEILERVQFPYPVVPIVRAHHEKWNGTGYPLGLRGEDIPIGARILSVVDAFDALASERQYRRALPLPEAMAKVEQDAGRSFDPKIIDLLKRRYVELEQKAQLAGGGVRQKLSKDLKVDRGDAPAAGFESSEITPLQDGQTRDLLRSLASARQDVQMLFESPRATGRIDIDETLALFAVRLKRLLPFDALAVYFVKQDKLVPGYVCGDNYRLFASLQIPIGQGLSGWVAENRRPIINGNPSVEPGYLNDPSVFSTLRSALAVPLEGSDGVRGVLAVYREAREGFSSEDLRLIQSIAPKLALSIEHAEQFDADVPDTTDTLSAIADGFALLRHLDSEIARCKRLNTPLAVLVCSLEGFMEASARAGRAEVDRALRSIALALKQNCGEFDFLARVGQSEFIIVMPGLNRASAAARVAKLMQVASAAGGATVTLVAGDAEYPADADHGEQLLAAADRRMFDMRMQRQRTSRVSAAGSHWVQ